MGFMVHFFPLLLFCLVLSEMYKVFDAIMLCDDLIKIYLGQKQNRQAFQYSICVICIKMICMEFEWIEFTWSLCVRRWCRDFFCFSVLLSIDFNFILFSFSSDQKWMKWMCEMNRSINHDFFYRIVWL